MNLKKVEIINYKNFENIVIDFEKNDFSNVYSIASENGGGKSTLLQFIFIVLHCFLKIKRKKYILSLGEDSLVNFIIENDGEEYYL